MNCEQAKFTIQENTDQRLAPHDVSELEAHLAACEPCQQYYKSVLEVKRQLRSIPRPKAPAGLAQRIVADRLQRDGRVHRRNLIWYSAMAAGLATVFLTGMLWLQFSQKHPPTHVVETAVEQIQPVRFLVNSRRRLEQVRFSVHLPQHLSIEGYGSKRQLTWSGKLNKGKNLLQLPVVSHRPQSGIVVLRIKHKDAVKEFKLKVQAQT